MPVRGGAGDEMLGGFREMRERRLAQLLHAMVDGEAGTARCVAAAAQIVQACAGLLHARCGVTRLCGIGALRAAARHAGYARAIRARLGGDGGIIAGVRAHVNLASCQHTPPTMFGVWVLEFVAALAFSSSAAPARHAQLPGGSRVGGAAGQDRAGRAAMEAAGPGCTARNSTEGVARTPRSPSDAAAAAADSVLFREAAGWVDVVAGALFAPMEGRGEHEKGGGAGGSGGEVGVVLLKTAACGAAWNMLAAEAHACTQNDALCRQSAARRLLEAGGR